jgi:hypothetical protein
MQHEKHQYYFEKYLRQEMPEQEKIVFERKLAEDASLRMAFEYYKLNRQQLLDELINEHQLQRKDGRLNRLIFALISLTGIALTYAYFSDKNNSTAKTQDTPNILVRYIPFLNWENRVSTKKIPLTQKTTDTVSTQPIPAITDTLEPSTDPDERLISDEFVSDTFVPILNKYAAAKLWMQFHQKDTILQMDTVNNDAWVDFKKHSDGMLLVEFWKSPFDFKGYLFTQNKLVVYGKTLPLSMYIFKEADSLFAIIQGKEIILTTQPKFTSF